MSESAKLIIHEEQTFLVGEDTFIDSITSEKIGVVFEDDGEAGFFYAVLEEDEMTILDALHIYDVVNVEDRDVPCSLKILWSEDLTKAFLSINDYYHAVFDFKNKAGYCRNGFPESTGDWAINQDRKLTDSLLSELLTK